MIGRGSVDFDRARAAIMAWKPFDIGWVDVFPKQAPIEVGTVVAVLIRHFGFWSLNGARVLCTRSEVASMRGSVSPTER